MRLIDAEYLAREIRARYEYDYPTASGAFDTFATRLVPNIIKGVPTIDPVDYLQRKGYVVIPPTQIKLYKCPHCGIYTPMKTEYCQQCYGLMEEEC